VEIAKTDKTGAYADTKQLECGPMPNVMAAQPNVRGALCWMLLIKSRK